MKVFTLFLLLMGALTAAGQQRNLYIPGKPLTSEDVAARMEPVVPLMSAEPDSGEILFIVARLGIGETNRELNRRRLFNVRERYVAILGVPAEKIMIVEGQRVNDYGRIELYWKGRFVDAFPVHRNKDIYVDCCDEDPRYYPLKDAVDRRAKRKRKRG